MAYNETAYTYPSVSPHCIISTKSETNDKWLIYLTPAYTKPGCKIHPQIFDIKENPLLLKSLNYNTL